MPRVSRILGKEIQHSDQKQLGGRGGRSFWKSLGEIKKFGAGTMKSNRQRKQPNLVKKRRRATRLAQKDGQKNETKSSAGEGQAYEAMHASVPAKRRGEESLLDCSKPAAGSKAKNPCQGRQRGRS